MASVVSVGSTTTYWGLDYAEDVLTNLGHTLTRVLDTSVTATNLSGYDLIILAYTSSDQETLASHIDNHMDTYGIPVFVYTDFHGLVTVDNTQTTDEKVANRLGMYARTYRNKYAGGVVDVGYGTHVPQDQFTAHEVSLYNPDYETQQSAVGQSFVNPIDDWEGESFTWGNRPDGNPGDIVTAQPGDGQVAGSPVLWLKNSYWGDYREVCGTVIAAGDSRVGQRTGTFSTNMAWMGISGTVLSGNTSQLFSSMVRWCLGEFDSLAYTTQASVCRYPSIDFSDIPGTTLASATMDWDYYWATGEFGLYYTSWDGVTWTQFATPGAIPSTPTGQPLAGMRLWIRAYYFSAGGTPPDSAWLANLKVTWTSNTSDLTVNPSDYFQEGHILWTSGNNAGQSMEVKSFDNATKTMKLFLKMREPIAVGDEFTVLPGCDKKKATCIAKFANVINFQGEPDIPGEDQTLKSAEVKG